MNKESEIILSLQSLNYPYLIEDTSIFIGMLNSPTKLRYDTLEWLFSLFEPEIIKQIQSTQQDQVAFILSLFKMFGINETKDNITAMSSEENNMKALVALIVFAKQYLKTKSDCKSSMNDLNQSCLLINFLHKNKVELFKENIRLFLPEIQLIEQQTKENEKKINVKILQDNIEETKALITKVEGKLDKLNQLALDYDIIDRDDSYELKEGFNALDKALDAFLKDYNALYEKELKYISEDQVSKLDIDCSNFMSQYAQIEKVALCLEEIFALHNRLTSLKLQ